MLRGIATINLIMQRHTRLRLEGASDGIIAVLDTVTRYHDETYPEFIKCVARNEIGCVAKTADLHDNLDLSRIAQPTQADLEI